MTARTSPIPTRPGWVVDGSDPTTPDLSWNPNLAPGPRHTTTPGPSEYDYPLPPGYTKSEAATDRTRLITTGSADGRLVEDYAPGAVHGYRERPPVAVPQRHTPPAVK